jgi:hypothetical protein
VEDDDDELPSEPYRTSPPSNTGSVEFERETVSEEEVVSDAVSDAVSEVVWEVMWEVVSEVSTYPPFVPSHLYMSLLHDPCSDGMSSAVVSVASPDSRRSSRSRSSL